MIFATVGTQLPFDRLLCALDAWAATHPDVHVIAQTGKTQTCYANLICHTYLDQAGFAELMAQASVVVAHAGMGTILSAAESGKPLILMPRRADRGEHRNDHQLATAAEMAILSNVTVIEESCDLAPALTAALTNTDAVRPCLPATASAQLLSTLEDFIWIGDHRSSRSPLKIHKRTRA